MGFFRQEYWSGLPFPSPGIEPGSPTLKADSFQPDPLENPCELLQSSPYCCPLVAKGKPLGYTHLISSESRPQGKLLIPLQEADFHIVDFVPIKHHQHVGLCPVGGVLLQWALFFFRNAPSTALKTVFSNAPFTVLDILCHQTSQGKVFLLLMIL